LLTQVLQLHFVTISKLPIAVMAFVCRKSAILIISQRVLKVMSPDVPEKLHEAVEKSCNEKIKSFDWSRLVLSGRQDQDGQLLPILQNFIVFVTRSFQMATLEPQQTALM
jgi:hypothetical protein